MWGFPDAHAAAADYPLDPRSRDGLIADAPADRAATSTDPKHRSHHQAHHDALAEVRG
ncbi:hypothetical protein [Pseudooceanicola nitratireducens]|uniref:hypothetical protein n=1 Tax=Pseudooceanicola nitratireducens TaxID=517719 RepID=UPI0023F359C8|nr:hypothetical protein [Pseudooceanicola nitratireducens]MEC7792361.1 hypothetical protein [Pseudomonadota bacterium]MEC9104847.1 hypothetical protein [Pseudomonadota bacterium]